MPPPCWPATRRCARTPTTGWCARRIGLLRRTLSAPGRVGAQPVRADRAGLVLRRHAGRAGVRCRPQPTCSRCPTMRRARRRSRCRTPTSALYPMATGQTPPRAPLLRRGRAAARARQERSAQPLDADAALALGLVTAAPDDIDWADETRIAIEERVAMSPDALTGWKPTCASTATRTWPRASSAASPHGRTGSSSAPTPSARRARSRSTARARRPHFDWNRV